MKPTAVTAASVVVAAAAVAVATSSSSSYLQNNNKFGGRDGLALPTSIKRTSFSCHNTVPRGGDASAHNDDDKSRQRKDDDDKKSAKKKKKKKMPLASSEKEKSHRRRNSASSGSAANNNSSSSSSSSSSSDKAKSSGSSNTDATTTTSSSSNSSNSSSNSMSPHQQRIVQQILQEEDYYSILGTTREASSNEIQKAYRKRAVLTHPDKMPNGDRRAFDKVAEAYDVLSDESKRRRYNQYGKKAAADASSSSSAHHHTTAEDLFRSFFSSSHHAHPFFRSARSSPTSTTRNRNVRYQLEVTLEELYRGMTKSVLVSHPTSVGDYHHPKRKRVEVHVPAGSFAGQSVVLSGEVDWDPDETPADIIFILEQRPHATLTRKGYDLAMEVTISLEEAICGVKRSFSHLDGRTVVWQSAHGAHSTVPLILQSGMVQVLRGEGMPKRGGRGHGDLYVQYKVEMPSTTATRDILTPAERDELKLLLSKLDHKNHQKGHHNDNNKPVVDGENSSDGQQQQHQHPVRVLQTASAVEFGRNAKEENADDDAVHDDDDNADTSSSPFHRSFGAGRQSFFSSSDSASHPFFDQDWNENENTSNVQCQQM